MGFNSGFKGLMMCKFRSAN